MYKNKIIFTLMICVSTVSVVFAQEGPKNTPIQNITGTVVGTDSVGNTIFVRTNGQRQMAFSVPKKAIITQGTHTIGLMDIGVSNAVSIQYYVSPSSKNTVVSIVDNESVVNE